MKPNIRLFIVAGLMALAATSCKKDDCNCQKDIADIKGQVTGIQGQITNIQGQITAINSSIAGLTSIDRTLQDFITALQEDGTNYESRISALLLMDTQLEERITGLEEYVSGLTVGGGGYDDEISALQNKNTEQDGRLTELENTLQNGTGVSEEWVRATFATLEQLDSLSRIVAAIPSLIDALSSGLDDAKAELTQGYVAAIETAVSDLETSMQQWVNGLFTGYYTIARMDAILDSLSGAHDAADASLMDEIEAQREELETARVEITTAYQNAISEAIQDYEGEVNGKIAADIAAASAVLQNQINGISVTVSSILSRLDEAEADIASLIDRIQSIVVIPQYDDGSVKVTGGLDIISFDISPVRIADSLAAAWQGATAAERAEMITIKIKGVMTKSGGPTASVETVHTEDGELKMEVIFSDLPDHAMASLHITNGKIDVSSAYFPLFPFILYPESPDITGVTVGGVVWAPVNCGYSSSEPGGLLYQWGRKYGQSATGTIYPSIMTKEDDTIENRNKFGQYNYNNYNWFSGMLDDNLWNEYGNAPSDPCPAGWHVPTMSEFEALITTDASLTEKGGPDHNQTGYLYGTSPNQVFLPLVGYRSCYNGTVQNAFSYYWTSSVNGDNAWNFNVPQNMNGYYCRSNGMPIRCARD